MSDTSWTATPEPPRWALYRLREPIQWPLGMDGDRRLFLDCADCGEKDVLVAGILAAPGMVGTVTLRREHLAHIERKGDPWFRPAVFCRRCTDSREERKDWSAV